MLRATSQRLLSPRMGWSGGLGPMLGGRSPPPASSVHVGRNNNHVVLTAHAASRRPMSSSGAGIQLLESAHAMAGLPPDCLACSVVATTAAFRAAIFPLVGISRRHWSRFGRMVADLDSLIFKMKRDGAEDDAVKRMEHRAWVVLRRKYGFNRSANIPAALATVPFTVCMFLGLHAASCYIPDTSLGLPELATASPFFLPALSGVTCAATPGLKATSGYRFVLAALSVPMAMQLSPHVLTFLVTNNVCLWAQFALLDRPFMRRYFDIWDDPTAKGFYDIRTNYKYAWRSRGLELLHWPSLFTIMQKLSEFDHVLLGLVNSRLIAKNLRALVLLGFFHADTITSSAADILGVANSCIIA